MIYHDGTYKEKFLIVRKNKALTYHRGQLRLKDMNSGAVDPILVSGQSARQRVLSKIRPFERLFRLEPRLALSYKDDLVLLSWSGALYLIDLAKKTTKKIYQYREGMHNPLMISKIANIPGFKDGFIFGDYWSNPKGGEVSIYRTDTIKCEKVLSFSEGSVLHIHGCVPDPHQNRVLILTGDSDNQTAIWAATDDFQVVTPIVRGCQKYRTCSVYPLEDGFLYATDTPLEENGIYHYSEATKALRKLYNMPGPCIYSTSYGDKRGATQYIFATSVEPDSSLPLWRYWMTSRLGRGVKEPKVHMITGNCEAGFSSICSFSKDVWPMAFFQFGNLQFPDQDIDDGLYVTATAVKQYDGQTLRFIVER